MYANGADTAQAAAVAAQADVSIVFGHYTMGETTDLAAGESRTVELTIDSDASNHPYSIWDVDDDAWTSLEGEYGIAVAASSRDIRLTDEVLVDRTAPVVAEVSLDRRNRVVIAATDELSGVDRIEYSVQKNTQPASAWTAYTGPFQVDAKSVISIRAIDEAGNISEVVVVNRKDLR